MKYIENKLNANIVKLEDANNNYTSENVEGALEEIASKAVVKLYSQDLGILPDTDITDVLKDLLSNRITDTIIYFEKNKTYYIREGGFELNVENIYIYGNGSTIKLIDNSGYLENIKNSDTIDRNIFRIKGNNIKINGFNFDGNIENNYFMFDGNKYYGYHPDISITGIPSKQIYYNVLRAVGDNITLENLNFSNVAGSALDIGSTSDIMSHNIKIYNCVLNKNFRGAVSFFNSRNIIIENCSFYHNQRHAIQFYTGNSYATVKGCYIMNNVSDIPIWYPTWSIKNADAETIGISIGHKDYKDINDNYTICNNIIDYVGSQGIKSGIAIRNYSRNVDIINNKINSHWHGIFINKGVFGEYNIISNTLNNRVENGIRLDFGVGNSNVTGNEVVSRINIEKNYIGGLNSFIFENATDATVRESYKKLTINVDDNIFYNNTQNFVGLDGLNENTNDPIVDIILHNNKVEDATTVHHLNYTLINKLITIRNKNETIIPNNYSANGLVKVAKIILKANSYANLHGEFRSYGNVDNPFNSCFSIFIKSTDINSNPTVKFSVLYKTENLSTDFLRIVLSSKTEDEMTLYLYIKHGDYSLTTFKNDLGNKGIVTFIGNRKTYSAYDVDVILEYTS